MSIDVSIIIPVYNTQNYINECLYSILKQNIESNIEIILINDGSTDDSLSVLEKIKEKHENIILINNKNQGAAQARNDGISIAKGQFVLFLDSDDYYLIVDDKKSTIDLILEKARNNSLDVVCFNYTRNESYKPQMKSAETYIDEIDYLIDNNLYTSSACTKLIKRDILKEYNIYFENGTLSEDIIFCAKILETNSKIAFVNEIIYFYRRRETSTTNSMGKNHILDLLEVIKKLSKSKNKLVLSYAGFQYATLMINMNLSSREIGNNINNEIYNYSYLLGYNKSKVIRFIYALTKLFSVKFTSKLLTLVYKIKGNS